MPGGTGLGEGVSSAGKVAGEVGAEVGVVVGVAGVVVPLGEGEDVAGVAGSMMVGSGRTGVARRHAPIKNATTKAT